MSEQKEKSLLDNIKEADRMAKVKTLQKVIIRIKEDAKEVLELKEMTMALLDTLVSDEKEKKSVIDFVNSLPEVQLSDKDKEKIALEAKEYISKEKKDIQEKLADPKNWNNLLMSYAALGYSGDKYGVSTGDFTSNQVYLTSQMNGNLGTSKDLVLNIS